MTKRIVRVAVVAAAAAAIVLPASAANAAPTCIPFGTFELVCLPEVSGS